MADLDFPDFELGLDDMSIPDLSRELSKMHADLAASVDDDNSNGINRESGGNSMKSIFDYEGNMSYIDLDKFFGTNDTVDEINKVYEEFAEDFNEGGERVSPFVFYLLSILYSVVILIGTTGNLIILYAIVSKRVMRTARNYFIVILAISDLLLCLLSMPLTLWDGFSRRWPFGDNLEWLCKLAHSCQGMPVFMSSMAIVAIALDRYRCIMLPDRPPFSARNALVLSALMAALATLLTIPMYSSAKLHHFIQFPGTVQMADILICLDTWDGHWKTVYTIVSSVAQFLLPFTSVIVIYISIYLRLRNRPQSQHAENNTKRRRANIMIISITLIFFISWLPLNLFSFLMELSPHVIRPFIVGYETVIYALLNLFGLCNACANPILYGYLNENFRKEYKGIYRQMPWYSVSEQYHHPAIHLHIMGNVSHAAASPVAAAAATMAAHSYNNNDEDDGGEEVNASAAASVATETTPVLTGGSNSSSRPCLIITSDAEDIETSAAVASIFQAARERRISMNMDENRNSPRLQRGSSTSSSSSSSSFRRLTLPGLGEVQVEKAMLSQRNNETMLEKIEEGEGEEGDINRGIGGIGDNALGGEMEELHVILFTTKSRRNKVKKRVKSAESASVSSSVSEKKSSDGGNSNGRTRSFFRRNSKKGKEEKAENNEAADYDTAEGTKTEEEKKLQNNCVRRQYSVPLEFLMRVNNRDGGGGGGETDPALASVVTTITETTVVPAASERRMNGMRKNNSYCYSLEGGLRDVVTESPGVDPSNSIPAESNGILRNGGGSFKKLKKSGKSSSNLEVLEETSV